MRMGGRVAAAIEILETIRRQNRPASQALHDWGTSHRFAGSGDRAAIGNLVYDSLRKYSSQAWRMDNDTANANIYATLLGQWNYSPEELNAIFVDDRFAPAPPESSWIGAWQTRNIRQAPGHVQAEIPAWCQHSFEQSLGESWIEEAAALAERPPLDLRVNSLKATREKVLKPLARYNAKPLDLLLHGIRIAPGERGARLPNVQAEAGYQKGWFEIQDAGSQLAAMLAGVKPGEQVLDYCAGAGGKTLAMSAAMENKGQIHAYDSEAVRLAPIHDRLKRAGARNVQVHRPDALLNDLAGKMDCVFVDAPCTGSGTWRRRPDAKWRLGENNLADRILQQDAVLANAARYVRPGGRLIYVTCSLLPEENTSRITAFLENNPDFTCAPFEHHLHVLCDNTHIRNISQAMLLMSPAKTGTDGFFAASMTKL
jgi:16S rRNA (cytosine967-C5)-methyltransferase